MARTQYRTKQQDLILAYLRTIPSKHFTAEDLKEHFESKQIKLGAATIYRQLDKLVSEGKLQKYLIDEHSATCFEYIEEQCNPLEQHFHLKCEVCGALIHLACDELNDIKTHLEKEHGFILNPFKTVFYGTCPKCAQNKKAE